MIRIPFACLLLFGTAISGLAQTTETSPFFRLRDTVSHYAGPGREAEAPQVDFVTLAFFGPFEDPPSGEPERSDLDPWRAAQMAVEDANDQGGYQGIPFQLHPIWSENPWGTGVAELTQLVYREPVWGIIGGNDGASTHLAEQVVAKARLTLVSPTASDKTINLANVPWMFSCLPHDAKVAEPLVVEIQHLAAEKPWVLVSATDHDSQLLTVELKKQLDAKHLVPSYHFQCATDSNVDTKLVQEVRNQQPVLVVVIADAVRSSELVGQLREIGYKGALVGGPAMGRRMCRIEPGQRGPLAYPKPVEPTAQWTAFENRFENRFSHKPDWAAAASYDATVLLIDAIRSSGLNRARIRDGVAGLSPWRGITGTIVWDGLGSNHRDVTLKRPTQ
ncbi:ABC transporter substrate-binding protein [Novipirellula artificiosorum]|uniref:Receptor family ligand binding region n=1 Tax=Novipirellula artificiosorum TaxID=2528016 RepID=A0A5C6DMB6_9BACT|nr:ABC transporter substrate-binding protein [Novipirellula artificiosorum]TWU35999.1 Receptor family ligand binding region [Novipirellula artificiosorum]